MARWTIRRAAVCAMALASGALGDQVLTTSSFTNCEDDTSIKVQKVDITYNNDAKTVTFDVAGTSSEVQNVTAKLSVTAYGQEVYSNSFNPCDTANYVEQLCPVPAGSFAARGSQAIPSSYANSIPSIAFQVPDIAAQATLQLQSLKDGTDVGCVKSQVVNGKTADIPAVSYVVAGIAGAAFVATGASALGAAFSGTSGTGGAGTMSPSFTEVVGVFQGFAMNGMMSVNYPDVYRSFAKNFGFSTGLIPWTNMQISIDNFREKTGGNLTVDSVQYLKNATLVFPDGSTSQTTDSPFKRALADFAYLAGREVETAVNSTSGGDEATSTQSSIQAAVSGLEAYAEQLAVPSSNTFMTVLLITAIVIASIIVVMLLIKVILETWALWGSFPQSWNGFRKHYWGSIARTITSLILLLYGIWVLYCVFQFTHGDSWAAQLLAGVTLVIFTAILAFFTWKIWSTVKKLKKVEGDASGLYDDKSIWMRYSLFYESYKKNYWWLFVPFILYMFAKGFVLAATDGKGMSQAICMLIIEGTMLGLLLWSRPFERKSGNIINIAIQVVRFLSIVCILFFVEEFGVGETGQTVTGVVLISIQSALTGILAILICWNAINACIKMNPHRQRRKELEKMQRDMDTLTPLDARNSLLMERTKADGSTTFSMANTVPERKHSSRDSSPDRYMGNAPEPANPYSALSMHDNSFSRPLTPGMQFDRNQDHDNLVSNAAPISGQGYRKKTHSGGYRGVY